MTETGTLKVKEGDVGEDGEVGYRVQTLGVMLFYGSLEVQKHRSTLCEHCSRSMDKVV